MPNEGFHPAPAGPASGRIAAKCSPEHGRVCAGPRAPPVAQSRFDFHGLGKAAMQDFWQSSGFNLLKRDANGWLKPTPAYVRILLAREELAVVPESCAAERALHAALDADPLKPVADAELSAVKDADARGNYAHFLRFRERLLKAGTLEGCYLALFRGGSVDVPPLFVDLMTFAIVRNLLDGVDDVYELRAGEMLFRRQRVSTENGQVLSADADTIELYAETGGFGNLGRLLAKANTPMPAIQIDVLSHENAQLYWLADERFRYVLDLTQGRNGLEALGRVLEKWIAHFLCVPVSILPRQRVEDDAWRWHVGLDVESTALLNDLYAGLDVDEARLARMISLFELAFRNPADMRADVRGKPVYLGLAMNPDNVLKLKAQNLLLNLPLAARM